MSDGEVGLVEREVEQIVIDFQPLLYSWAERLSTSRVDWEDLVGVGNVALCRAVSRYDPEKGSLAAYATVAVRREMTRHRAENENAVLCFSERAWLDARRALTHLYEDPDVSQEDRRLAAMLRPADSLDRIVGAGASTLEVILDEENASLTIDRANAPIELEAYTRYPFGGPTWRSDELPPWPPTSPQPEDGEEARIYRNQITATHRYGRTLHNQLSSEDDPYDRSDRQAAEQFFDLVIRVTHGIGEHEDTALRRNRTHRELGTVLGISHVQAGDFLRMAYANLTTRAPDDGVWEGVTAPTSTQIYSDLNIETDISGSYLADPTEEPVWEAGESPLEW